MAFAENVSNTEDGQGGWVVSALPSAVVCMSIS